MTAQDLVSVGTCIILHVSLGEACKNAIFAKMQTSPSPKLKQCLIPLALGRRFKLPFYNKCNRVRF